MVAPNPDLASILTEATNTYSTLGTMGADADALNRAIAANVDELAQHITACTELHAAVHRAAHKGQFCAGDYMVYFTLAFHLRQLSLQILLLAMYDAARLSATSEFGLAWDLVQVVALALSMVNEPPDEDTLLQFGQLFSVVLTFPTPPDLAMELPSSIATVLDMLPPYMTTPIFNAIALGLKESQPRYDVLALVAHAQLSGQLTPQQRMVFTIRYWLPSIDESAEPAMSVNVLDLAMNTAIIAVEDAQPERDTADTCLTFLLRQLRRYPLRARLEHSRHIIRLALQLRVSREVLASARVQRAHWLASIDRDQARYELRLARGLWPSGRVPHETEAAALLAVAGMAFQLREHDKAVLLLDRAADHATSYPYLMEQVESRRSTLSVLLGHSLAPGGASADTNYVAQMSRLFAEATSAFRSGRTQHCIDLANQAVSVPKQRGANDASFTRRRTYSLRAAAHLHNGDLKAALSSVLDAIDELTDSIKRHVGGTEQATAILMVSPASSASGWQLVA